ncbi:MAG: L-lactate dehydrogenase [Candidatus Promineifilaceae bacterium]|nr:L-lactate dehydrogenase [Candidatus Promineifilaceae bacterium]
MKVGIVGTGNVGSTAAYALVMQGIGREIVLVDLDKERAAAEAADLLHAVPFAHALKVRSGEYADLDGCRVVIITAGVSQRPGETRLQLLERNAAVFRDVVPSILDHAPDTILLVASNPVDVMTHLTAIYAEECGVPAQRVLGSGTTLDTARFRALLSEYVGIDAAHIHGYVIGEHGDSEVLTWSLTTVGNLPLAEFCRLQGVRLDDAMKEEIDGQVRGAAYRIIEGKGATYYGIGSALARIVNVVLRDQRAILTVCSRLPEAAGVTDVTFSLPQLVGGDGVLATFRLPLSDEEQEALHGSAEVIRGAIDELEEAL